MDTKHTSGAGPRFSDNAQTAYFTRGIWRCLQLKPKRRSTLRIFFKCASFNTAIHLLK